MVTKQQNPLEEVRDGIRHIWLHRRGNEAHAAIADVIDACWPNQMKPIIVKKIKINAQAFKFLINLPAGLGYREFKAKEQLFSDAIGGMCQIEKRGKAITMQASTAEIKKVYPYAFDPSDQKGHLPIHFGFSSIGEIIRDLAAFPNVLIAGHPGAGKSNFLHCLIFNILQNQKTPTRIVGFDFKQLEYSYLKEHIFLVTKMDFARKVFRELNKKLDENLNTLEAAGCVKIQEYLAQGQEMPFYIVIIDELAEMKDEECQEQLNRLLRLGRAAGFCIVCATQRPSSTMMKAFGDSKAMFSGTMCFHVRDSINSNMLLDNDRAALIPNVPGRGIYQWDVELETQGMFLPVDKARKLLQSLPGREVINLVNQLPKRLPPR